MLFLFAALTLAASPIDSFHVKISAPADLPLTVTYQLQNQPVVTRRLQGTTEFRMPAGEVRLVVSSEQQGRDFHVDVRGPKNKIVGTGRGSCVVEINTDRNRVHVTTDAAGTCRSNSAVRT